MRHTHVIGCQSQKWRHSDAHHNRVKLENLVPDEISWHETVKYCMILPTYSTGNRLVELENWIKV